MMTRKLKIVLFASATLAFCVASVSVLRADPFLLYDTHTPLQCAKNIDGSGVCMRDTSGRTVRSQAYQPGLTMVLITGGQSIWANTITNLYVPEFASQIDSFNIYDGKSYDMNGPAFGATVLQPSPTLGPGNLSVYVADEIIRRGIASHVILAAMAVGGASVQDWATGVLKDRGAVMMRRLLSQGISPSNPNTVFVYIYGDGESNNVMKTSQAGYTALATSHFNSMFAAGFVGKIFVPKETWYQSRVWKPVQDAQTSSLPNGVNIFWAGDLDSLGDAYRSDTTHFNNLGGHVGAQIVVDQIQRQYCQNGAPLAAIAATIKSTKNGRPVALGCVVSKR